MNQNDASRRPALRRFLREVRRAVREGPKLYVAPLRGAIRAIRAAWLNRGHDRE